MTYKAKHKRNLTVIMNQIMPKHSIACVNLNLCKIKNEAKCSRFSLSRLLLFSGLGVESHKQYKKYKEKYHNSSIIYRLKYFSWTFVIWGWGYNKARVQCNTRYRKQMLHSEAVKLFSQNIMLTSSSELLFILDSLGSSLFPSPPSSPFHSTYLFSTQPHPL